MLRAIDGDASGLRVTGSMEFYGTQVPIWEDVPFEEAFGPLVSGSERTVSIFETTNRCAPSSLEYATADPGVVARFARVP